MIAHETGHIAGGHLTRSLQAQQNAGLSSLAGVLLGAAAAVAGAPQLGTAIMAGGATVAQSGFLKFSRGQEQAADQAAVTYLRALEMSPEGLLDFFHVLETQNLRISADGNEYPAHPSADPRPDHLPGAAGGCSRPIAMHGRARSCRPPTSAAWPSWTASCPNPAQVLRHTGERQRAGPLCARDRLLPAARPAQGAGLVDGLIAEAPKDPYFHELKGQILFENGRIAESVPPYREAVRYRPDSALLRYGLARALIEGGSDSGAGGGCGAAAGGGPDRAAQRRRLAVSWASPKGGWGRKGRPRWR